MVDEKAEGAEGAPFQMQIELGKLREFARAVHAPPATAPPEEKARPFVLPTFLTTQFFWEIEVPDSNPWDLVQMSQERGMHAEQEYVFHGPPPRAGDTLQCRSRIERIFAKTGRRGGKLTFAVMVTEFRDASGKLVAEARLTGVETEKPPEDAP